MKRTSVASIALALAIGGSASAWGAETQRGVSDGGAREAHTPKVLCKALDKIKASFDAKTTHWTQLTPAQFHFIEGVYVGSPTTPEGPPPGDGAILAQRDGDNNGVIVWTRGPLACAPVPIPEKLVKMLTGVKGGPQEGDLDL